MALRGALGSGLGARDATFVSRGRRGTILHPPSFRVAGVARGRRGTTLHPPSFHVAGVAQSYIHLRFAWQAWHSWHSVARLGLVWARVMPRHFAWQAWRNLTSTFVSRGKRGTILHPPSFRVAGVALMALRGALGSGLGARDAAAFCVAGVAQPYIHLRFTWQAWHNLTSTFVSRGRRGTHGTPWRAWVWFGRAHTYIHTYIRNIHTYIPTVLPSRSFTTSFVFPSFPVPAKTIEAHYWKKLTCGVIRSFNFCNTLAVFKAHNTLNSKNTLHLHFRSDLHVR